MKAHKKLMYIALAYMAACPLMQMFTFLFHPLGSNF